MSDEEITESLLQGKGGLEMQNMALGSLLKETTKAVAVIEAVKDSQEKVKIELETHRTITEARLVVVEARGARVERFLERFGWAKLSLLSICSAGFALVLAGFGNYIQDGISYTIGTPRVVSKVVEANSKEILRLDDRVDKIEIRIKP